MRCAFRVAVLAVAAVLAFAAVGRAADDKVRALIIDGQHNHKWQETTPVVRDILLKTGRFTVDVLTAPAAKAPKEAWDAFKPDFSKYQVVVMNYHGTPWAEDINRAFEKFVQDGGGLVFYHAAVFSFDKWENWNRMMGLGWRNAKFGDRLAIDDSGKLVRQPRGEGPGAGHGPAHPFEVMLRDREHPITKGMPEKWGQVKDELYHGQRGPAENMHILATAFSAKDKGGTGMHEPIAWVIPVGKGRVFVSLLGHDVPATTAPEAAALLARGVEWAATGQVTIPPPTK